MCVAVCSLRPPSSSRRQAIGDHYVAPAACALPSWLSDHQAVDAIAKQTMTATAPHDGAPFALPGESPLAGTTTIRRRERCTRVSVTREQLGTHAQPPPYDTSVRLSSVQPQVAVHCFSTTLPASRRECCYACCCHDAPYTPSNCLGDTHTCHLKRSPVRRTDSLRALDRRCGARWRELNSRPCAVAPLAALRSPLSTGVAWLRAES